MMFARSTRFIIQRSYSSLTKPSKQIPDVQTFLTKIGRNSIELQEHFPDWKALLTTTSRDLKEKGIDVQHRRYILRQLEHLKQGDEITEHKLGKKSFFAGERKRRERLARLEAEKRAERYAIEDAQNNQ